MQSEQMLCQQWKTLLLLALLGSAAVWFLVGTSHLRFSRSTRTVHGSDIVAYDEITWCSEKHYEVDSEYERILDKLLDELTYRVAEESEDLLVISNYGLFIRAQCWVEDWAMCAACVSFLASNVDRWCPRSKVARVASKDCAIEYAFDTKTILDEDDVLFEPVEPIEQSEAGALQW
ncbi:hypothetical protein R1flu_009197 [Riccia fluitans]|uniref:Gnk2-homologous domain-containing protein n=1 Tax=Riccia fluitans TaxID=41844 RepID=A0ABD1Z1D3_9MARC